MLMFWRMMPDFDGFGDDNLFHHKNYVEKL